MFARTTGQVFSQYRVPFRVSVHRTFDPSGFARAQYPAFIRPSPRLSDGTGWADPVPNDTGWNPRCPPPEPFTHRCGLRFRERRTEPVPCTRAGLFRLTYQSGQPDSEREFDELFISELRLQAGNQGVAAPVCILSHLCGGCASAPKPPITSFWSGAYASVAANGFGSIGVSSSRERWAKRSSPSGVSSYS